MMIHSLTTASEPSDGRSQTTQHSHRSIGLEGSNVHTNTRSPRKSLQPRRQRVNWNALGKQLHPVYLVKSFFRSIKHVPIFVWYLFVEAFVIPEYRPEWGPFRKWRPFFETSEAKAKYLEYIKLKCRRRRKKVQIAEALPKPVVHDHSLCKIIKLNVSGKIYQTTLRTLCHFPNTLLGNPRRLGQFFDPIEEDYFFDRSRACFDAILQYYQTRGTLRRPSDISLEIFEEEIQFYDLGQHVIEQLRIDEGIYDELEKPVPRNLLKRKFWLLFEYPHSSSQARIVAMLSVFVVLVSITVFCLDTMPSIQLPRDNLPISLDGPFFLAETACVSWFIFEFLMRALNAPGTIAFFKSPTNIIDFLAILPYFMYIFLALRHNFFVASRAWLEPISQVMKLAKVLRILKLCRYNKGLQVLGKTLRASVRELMLLMFLLIIGLVLFSSTVFFAERIMDPAQANFTSIPDAFWWSIVTMVGVIYIITSYLYVRSCIYDILGIFIDYLWIR